MYFSDPPWSRRPRDASTDFYHPQHPQARPRRQARLRLHSPRLPPGRPLVVRQLPLDPSGHYPLVPHPGSPRQHGLDPRLLAGRPRLHRQRLLPGPRPAPVGRLPDRPPRGGQDPGPCHRGRGTLVRPSRLADRRLVVLHARCRRAASYFGQPGNQAKGCGFPVAHILALFHAGTGLLLEVFAAPLRSHDMAGVGGIFPC